MKNIQPKSTKLLRERIEATKNKNRVDIATSPNHELVTTSSHELIDNNNDSVIFEEEEVTANSREAVPDNETQTNQAQTQQYTTNFNEIQIQTNNQNKTYIPAPPTMKILSDEEVAMRSRNENEVRKRNKVQFTTNAKQIQDKQKHKNKIANKVQSTPQSQYKQTPQAPKMNKQQSNYKKVLSPSELNDSFI